MGLGGSASSGDRTPQGGEEKSAARGVEPCVHTAEVTGSNPVSPTVEVLVRRDEILLIREQLSE
jgi:hypothetical protein